MKAEKKVIWSVVETICGKPSLTSFVRRDDALSRFVELVIDQVGDDEYCWKPYEASLVYDNGIDYRVDVIEHDLVLG